MNEDRFLIADLNKCLRIVATNLARGEQESLVQDSLGKLLVVADGMGGHPSGDRASAVAVRSILHYTQNCLRWFFRLSDDPEKDFLDDLRSALEHCQSQVLADAGSDPGREGMGTTLTAAYIVWPRLYVVHVGEHASQERLAHRDAQSPAQIPDRRPRFGCNPRAILTTGSKNSPCEKGDPIEAGAADEPVERVEQQHSDGHRADLSRAFHSHCEPTLLYGATPVPSRGSCRRLPRGRPGSGRTRRPTFRLPILGPLRLVRNLQTPAELAGDPWRTVVVALECLGRGQLRALLDGKLVRQPVPAWLMTAVKRAAQAPDKPISLYELPAGCTDVLPCAFDDGPRSGGRTTAKRRSECGNARAG